MCRWAGLYRIQAGRTAIAAPSVTPNVSQTTDDLMKFLTKLSIR